LPVELIDCLLQRQRLTDEPLALGKLASSREHLPADGERRSLGIGILRRAERRRLQGEALGLIRSAALVDNCCELRHQRRPARPLAHLRKPLDACAILALGNLQVAAEPGDPAGHERDTGDTPFEAEVVHDRARPLHDGPAVVDVAVQRTQGA
jgi:hypothetical protein